jgi:Fe-S-cluster containining protein
MPEATSWGPQAREAFERARDPARLATAVVRFYATLDEVIAATVRGHAVPVACASGCNYCCHLRLEVQPHEAFALADWLRKRWDAARLAGLIARLRANAERTRELGAEQRKRTNLACALLGEDGRCQAYAARPAQCRRYHSMRVATCREFFEGHSEEIESPMHPAIAHNAAVVITQAQHAVREAGLDAENCDLNFALLEALENPKALKRWKDGKKPFVKDAP